MPGFQLLESGQPDPTLRPVLRALRAFGMGEWERALWFVVPSPALGGARPVDRLLQLRRDPRDEGTAALVAAADPRRDWF